MTLPEIHKAIASYPHGCSSRWMEELVIVTRPFTPLDECFDVVANTDEGISIYMRFPYPVRCMAESIVHIWENGRWLPCPCGYTESIIAINI